MTYDLNSEMDLIERYLDGALTLQEEAQVEQLLNDRSDLREAYHNMKLAIESVRYAGLTQQVSSIAKEYSVQQAMPATPTTAKVRSIGFYAMRATAVVLVTVASYTAVMYATATPDRLYEDGFVAYELSTTRNNTPSSAIEQAYKSGDWQQVQKIVSAETTPGQKELFLAGMSALQVNNPQQAVSYFQDVIASNAATGNEQYRDESQYYLALSYVKQNEGAKAYPLLQSIRNNPSHAYYKDAGNINLLKIKLLNWKK